MRLDETVVLRACRTLPEVPGSSLPLSGRAPEPLDVQPAWVSRLALFSQAPVAVSSRQPSLPVAPAEPEDLETPESAETAARPGEWQASFSEPVALAAV